MKKKVDIAGINFSPVRYDDVLTAVEVFVRQEKTQHTIFTPNPEMLVNANKNPDFQKTLNSASLLIPDGIGILWAAHYLSLPKAGNRVLEWFRLWGSLFKVVIRSKKIYEILPERVTGTDTLFKIVDKSQEKKWRIYLLGAAPGVANEAINQLLKKYPKATFAGGFAGDPSEALEGEIVDRINRATPDILFVAYGSPAQEEWITRNLKKMQTVKVALGVGGAIDFAAGRIKRSPTLMRKLGLEWLWRLFRQPKRIKRIWTATVVFVRLIASLKGSEVSDE